MARKIGSRYTAHTVIGRGSAGTVWLGDGPEGPVAIKILREDLASDQVLVGRFVQERTALTSLDHPRVVGVHDLVVDGDDLALVMELVHGSDLRSKLDRDGALPPQAAVSIAADVAEGLAAAHAEGVVHRDVKPENILLDQASSPGPGGAPRAKLSDFGIARLVDAPRRTRATRIIGTPDYLAPEVIEGLEPRAAVDIYALATVLYELLAGFTPFGGGHTGAVLRRHVTETVPPLPGLPEPLWKVLAQCLAKAPASRLRAAELATALRELLPSLAGLPPLSVAHPDAPPVTPMPGYDGSDVADPAENLDEPLPRARHRRGPAVPLVPTGTPDDSRATHTSLRRPSPEELASFAAASRAERAAAARAGLRRSGAGRSTVRRRRLIAAGFAVLLLGGVVGGYAAFSGGGKPDTVQHKPGDAASPTADRTHSASLPKAPVAGQVDATGPAAATRLPDWSGWAAAPAPPAPLVTGVRAARAGGTVYVFGTDASGSVRYLTRTSSGSYGAWVKLTGIHVSGEPAPVPLPGGGLRLFARGTDGLVYWRDLNGGAWSPWSQLDARTKVDSPPAAAANGDRIDLVARIDGQLATTAYVGGAWTAWAVVPLPGKVTGTPTLAAESNGDAADAFVTAATGEVLRSQVSKGFWHQAVPVTGLDVPPSRPDAVSASGTWYVFTADPKYAAGHGTSWTPGTLPATSGTLAPAAVRDSGGHLLVFRVTPAGAVTVTQAATTP